MSTSIGATYLGGGATAFRVWAPFSERVELVTVTPERREIPLRAAGAGYHEATVRGTEPGHRYLYRLDGGAERPDPASRSQPEGVHGPSEVVDPGAFAWSDHGWFGLPLRDYVIYELHVGTFSPAGTFDAVHEHLGELASLGVTAVEIMPVAQFPGERNWGYDGVFPYAPQNSYGGPDGLRRLVDACHARGLAVVLDVVYNHLGPEGCYLGDFGPYFTDAYRTLWGQGVNFDQEDSDAVREFFIGNALHWFAEYHIDALRLDAVHTIHDISALPFLEELAGETRELSDRLNRRLHLIAESADNDARLIAPTAIGGYGMDAQWNDDFHHSLYALLTGEQAGYYQDYGTLRHLARAMSDGFVYQGEYSRHRRRRHGRSSRSRAAERFVVFSRNHDQIGNRMLGERLSVRLPYEKLKLACGVILLSPYIPLLFMGEEYAETAPFLYFISHSDPELVEAVRRGREREFASFGWEGEPPDPQTEDTFLRSKLDRELRRSGKHATMWELYRELLQLRRSVQALARGTKEEMGVTYDERTQVMSLRRWRGEDEALALFHFGTEPVTVPFPEARGAWTKLFESADTRWEGPGATAQEHVSGDEETLIKMQPSSFVLWQLEGERHGEIG